MVDERLTSSLAFDASPHLVCSEPNIWVFDGLLSERFLSDVDDLFEREVNCSSVGNTWDGRSSRMLELDLDTQAAELLHVLRRISHIDEIHHCSKALVLEIAGKDQMPHMDRVEMDIFGSPAPDCFSLLDWSRLGSPSSDSNGIVPTLSFVIYFNEVGGCTFSHAKLSDRTIPGKRGRIIMFQNYIDEHRPAHNPAALHFGVYGASAKRIMTAGMLSSFTPPALAGQKLSNAEGIASFPKGILYCPNRHDYQQDHGHGAVATPAPAPPRPREKSREWWWLQGDHKIPVEVIQWKMYEPEMQAKLTDAWKRFGASRRGGLLDMEPAPYQIRRGDPITVTNNSMPEIFGNRMIAGWSAAFWDLPRRQMPPSRLLREGRGVVIEGFYQVRLEDVGMMSELDAFLTNDRSPDWPYPDRPYPIHPRRRVVLLIEEVEGLTDAIHLPPESEEQAEARRKATNMFNSYNTGVNGRMGIEEFSQMLRMMDPNWPDGAIRSNFNSVDTNSDGYLDLEEFVRWAQTPDSVGSVLIALS